MQQASPSAAYYVFDCCSLIAKLVYGLKRVTRIWILDGNKMVLFLLNGGKSRMMEKVGIYGNKGGERRRISLCKTSWCINRNLYDLSFMGLKCNSVT